MREKTSLAQMGLESYLPPPKPTKFFPLVLYHLKTAFLFTKSDLKTTLLPATVFATTALLSRPLLTTAPPTNPSTHSPLLQTTSTTTSPTTPCLTLTTLNITLLTTFLLPLLKSLLWTYLNLWIFNLSNQRLPNSILEDTLNKPWRPLPSNRLTPTTARHLLLLSLPLVHIASSLLGASHESLVLFALTWIYNDLGAADDAWLLRHLCNAAGFVFFGAGAARVACGVSLNLTAVAWLAMIGLTITTTIQFQDMEDQVGDRERGRKTVPIVFGDDVARKVNAVAVLAASLGCVLFWGLATGSSVMGGGMVAVGAVIAGRTVGWKGVESDRGTFKLWCGWLVGLYLLPLAVAI